MNLGLLVLRLVIGLLFVGHGSQKLFGSFGGHGPQKTAAAFESLGLRPGRFMALAAGASELAGGALIALGLLTPLGAALVIAVMLTAVWTVHLEKGVWITEGGFEYNLVVVAVAFALAGVGAGEWSLDNILGFDLAGGGWALAALAAGLFGAWSTIMIGHASLGQRPGPAHPAGR
jgi:putative oxidoreductase